ncbi:hypothetical protein J4711_13370, partial [Staphylococcus epidermidis]|nr:hypothetical protein [Staphylococcus epidermidis]
SRDWIAPAPAQSQIGRDIDSFHNFITLRARRSPKIMGLVSSLTACHLKLLYWQVNPATFVLAHCVKTVGEAIPIIAELSAGNA